MSKKKVFLLMSCISLVLMMTVLVTPSRGATVWKLNFPFLASHELYPHLQWAVNEIKKRSNNQLIIDLYPAFALGFKPTTWLRDHKEGLIDISMVFVQFTPGEEPSFSVVESDGLVPTKADYIRVTKATFGFKKRVYQDVWNSELISTGYIPENKVMIGTRGKQVKTIPDLKGLKIRVPNPRQKELYVILGAAPQFLPKSELYMALKTGVIDGFFSGFGSIHNEKLGEVIDYAVMVGPAQATQSDIVVSRRLWDPLSDDLKKIVREVFLEWGERTAEDAISGRAGENDKRLLEKAGIICTELSKADLQRICVESTKITDAWVKKEGGRVSEAWEIIKPFLAK